MDASLPTRMTVPIARADLLPEEIDSVLEPLTSGWLVQGPKVAEFEQKWSEFTGAEHSVAVTSCTAALELSLAALGVGPGDEVIVPAFTWISTANVVEHLGAKVVFADISLDTFNVDIEAMKAQIGPKTAGLMPVHLFGLAADMTAVMDVARQNSLCVVEDAACGFGSYFAGAHSGTFGDTGCFSFHPRKAITTGEGGMVTTNDSELAKRIRQLRDHGAGMSDLARHRGPKPYLLPDFPDAGYNQRMTDIQAALGSAQMKRADAIIQERRRLAGRYQEAFSDLDWLQTPKEPDGSLHGYQSFPCLFEPDEAKVAAETANEQNISAIGQRRNAWMESLQQAGISTRPATHAVHMLTFYREKYGVTSIDFPNAFVANECSISLPLFHGLTESEQDYVIDVVRTGPR
jgi:dTDP-4-amino-4,6-dideoxygalactose transaminase